MVRPTAAPVILHFLRHVGATRMDRIVRYMDTQWCVAPGTTRNTVSKLVKAGRVVRVGYGRYALGGSGADQAGNEVGALGHILNT